MGSNPAKSIDDRTAPAGARSGHAMPSGTRLRDYEITGRIGEDGFGIVYVARDHSLQRKVAVKEYMPHSMAARVAGSSAIVVESERQLDTFKAGLKSFVDEARLLARFDHPSLVKVYRFWEENGTAYMVMPFYEGPTLQAALAELGHVPSEGELRTWLRPVLDAVTVLHEGGVWHQNINPGGILLTPVGPVLLGLAAAEHAIAEIEHTPAAALHPGFAAIEQYGSVAATTRGPWTDLYALAAVIYASITGSSLAPAADRLAADHLLPLSILAEGLYSKSFLAAIDAALAVQPERRPRDHLQFRGLMGDIDAPAKIDLLPGRDLMQEPFIGAAAGDRQVTVPDRAVPAKAAPAPPGPAAARPARSPSAARAGPADSRPGAKRRSPAWMAAVSRLGAGGKRAIYGIVAVGCVLIGVAALVVQFSARQANPPAAVSVPAAVTPRPAAPPAPTAAAAPVARIATAAAAPVAANPPASAASAPTAAPDELAPPQTVAERQARCIDILQKASLEKISAAETNFFKRECK